MTNNNLKKLSLWANFYDMLNNKFFGKISISEYINITEKLKENS